MKSPTSETQCAECIFQKQYTICAKGCVMVSMTLIFYLCLQTKYQGHANHDTTFENS